MNIPLEAIITAILMLFGFLVKRQFNAQDEKNSAYDRHLLECNSRRERDAGADATIAEKIKTIEENSCQTERTVGWLGDCMQRMGTKLDVELPDRPE